MIHNFEHIMEAMPFDDEAERLVYAVLFCRNLAGCSIVIPTKQPERALATEMFKKGYKIDVVSEATQLNKRTLQQIRKDIANIK